MDIERRIPRIANVQQNHANAHLTDLMDFFWVNTIFLASIIWFQN
jgi:hypothetical protein